MRRLPAWLLLLGACGASEPSTCGVPDVACPAEAPYSGLACAGELECFYAHPDFPSDPRSSRFTCASDAWREDVLCDGCPPRRFEACRDADTDPIPGARVHVVLADEPIVIGPQGAAMLAYTLEVDGLDAERRCVSVREALALDDLSGPGAASVVLHCGRSLTIHALLPGLPCAPGDHAIAIEVEVEGAGSDRASLVYDGARCPPLPG